MNVLARNQSQFIQVRNLKRKKHLKQKFHSVQSIQNEKIVFSLFLSMEYEKLVPDVDDYDDDNSLASLFLSLLCGALPGAPLAAASRLHWLSHVKHRKNFEKLRNLSCVLERTSSACQLSKTKIVFAVRAWPGALSPRPAALADSSEIHRKLHTFVAT